MAIRKIKQSPKLPAEKRCEQLLASARRLITKKGYRETTTDEIARNAGLTKGALYYHFSSKEDILFTLVRQVTDANLAQVEEAFSRPGAPAGILRNLLEQQHLGARCDHRDNFDFWIQAMRVPRIKRYVNKRFREIITGFSKKLDPSFGSKAQRKELAVFTFALLHGLRIRRVLDPDLVDAGAQAKLYNSLLDSKFGKTASGKGKR